MKKILFTLLPLLILLLSGCSEKKTEAKSIEQLYKENGVPVKVTTVVLQPLDMDLAFTSVLTGYKESTASAKVADKVEKINFQVGDQVQQDDVIMTFPKDNPAASYYQSQVAFELSETTLKRMENLYKQGGISQQEYDNTRTQYKVTKANWEAVQQTVLVKAPISGILTRINVSETDNVEPGDPLFTISQNQRLKTKVQASENQVKYIADGCKAAAVWGDITIPGRVIQVDQSLNSATQAFGVLLEFENTGKIMSGVNADITILATGNKETIITDRKNILTKNGQNIVYVAENNKAVEKPIQIGRTFDTIIEIVSGINPGELLITQGQSLVSNGTLVKIIE